MVFNLDDREMDESFLLSAPTGPNRIPAASAKIPWRATAIFNFPSPLSYARQTWS